MIKLTKIKLVNNKNNKHKIVNFMRIYYHYADVYFQVHFWQAFFPSSRFLHRFYCNYNITFIVSFGTF